MTSGGELDRRSFLVGASAAGGGFALGFAIPSAARDACAPPTRAPEINCWVVIAPDDTVTIRVARSEMGQGAMTGLAMLVAEELECDWAKVRTEFVSPVENLRRDRVWGDTVDRRQPLDRVLAGLSAPRRRHRAGNADRRRGGALERAAGAMRCAQTARSRTRRAAAR